MNEPSDRFGMLSGDQSTSKSPPRVLNGENAEQTCDEHQRRMRAKGPAKQRSMRGDEDRQRKDCGPRVSAKLMTFHRSHRGHSEHEVKTTDADRPAFDRPQSRLIEQRDDFLWIDVAMAVKMGQETRLALRNSEIDDKHASSSLDHAADFACALLPQFARQVVEHQRAQHDIEVRVGKRQCLGNRVLESHVDSRVGRLRGGPRDHRRRGVDAEDLSVCANLAFGDDRQRSRPAPDIEHRFAADQMRQANQLLAERTITSPCEKPHQEVVSCRPMQNAANRCGCRVR